MNLETANYAEIDLGALAHNLSYVQQLAGQDKQIIASIKANAYGHDVLLVAKALQEIGVDALATGSLDEARLLRTQGITLPILLFAFSTPRLTVQAAIEGYIPTLTNLKVATTVANALKKPAAVYLKVDVGLGRLGEPINTARHFVEEVVNLPNLRVDGIYTHVPFAQTSKSDWAERKLQSFDRFITDLGNAGYTFPLTQAMASCCLLAGFLDQSSAVCVGHALYGLSPFESDSGEGINHLKPVMKSVKSKLIHIAHHAKGSDIAVGGLYGLERAHTVGVLPVGMAHGFCRPPGKDIPVLVRGQKCRVLSVSLEHTTIDLSGIDGADTGDSVTLLGRDAEEIITLATLADAWGIQPLEVLMRLSGKLSVRTVETQAS